MPTRFSSFHALALVAAMVLNPAAHAQKKMPMPAAQNADLAQLEGVTLKHKNASMLVLSNATLQKSAASAAKQPANGASAPSLLRKIGPYEIHKTAGSAGQTQANGKSTPSFAQVQGNGAFIGAAYLHDRQTLGLISKEVAVKFKSPARLAAYQAYAPKELVRNSGLYVLNVSDIYEWVKVVSRLQADAQVTLVEPQIVTEFATPQ
jgi:hypothetical protein